jgi:hypothetical protein
VGAEDAGGIGEFKIVRANAAREVVTSDSFVSLYVNDTQIEVTPWDFKLIFGEITSPATPESLVTRIKTTAEVRMSPQHVKKLVEILTLTVQRYEAAMGEIPQPKG